MNTRRSFFAALLAPFVARFVPKKSPPSIATLLNTYDPGLGAETVAQAFICDGNTFYMQSFVRESKQAALRDANAMIERWRNSRLDPWPKNAINLKA